MIEKILSLLKKDFVYLELEKKDALAFWDSLAGYIKAVYYCCFFLTCIVLSSAY